jgi:predicted RNA-binding Zn-ribbon protein involved in translation (DUF1610 family)
MRVSRRVNKSVVAAVALSAGLLLAPGATTTASALPPCCGEDVIYTYYSTSAKTTEVGEIYNNDDCGTPYQWGVTTPYYKIQRIYCATSAP